MSGWPGTGKTTLAPRVGKLVRAPVFTKDAVKELLFELLGVGDRAWSKALGRAAIQVLQQELETTLAAGLSAIGESNWDASLSGPELRAIVDRTGALPLVVAVNADADVIMERYRRRAESGERHPGHLDAELVDEIDALVRRPYEAPDLGTSPVQVDLTDLGEASLSAALDQVAEALEVLAPHAVQHRSGD